MATVFWDTNLFVYVFEDHPQFATPVLAIRQAMHRRGDRLVTSAFAVGEVLALPARLGENDIVKRYEAFFESPEVTVLPFDIKAASKFAQIRKNKSISRADAVHLACASAAGVDLFLTNDLALSKHTVPGITFISTIDKSPL